MNKIHWVQTGGVPLKAERLNDMFEAYSIFNAYGHLAGNLSIISGCQVEGNIIRDGYVYINGELIEFRESYFNEGSTVAIGEETSLKEFENGEQKVITTVRYATIGIADVSWPWSSFKRIIPLQTIPLDFVARFEALERKAAVFTAGGGMVLWNKPAIEIPPGWQEVVNWRGRIPVGLDTAQTEFNVIGKQGGAKNKTLSIAEMPAHTHKIQVNASDSGNHNRRIQGGDTDAPGWTDQDVESVGGGQAFSILNPYRVVMFIEYVG